MKQRILSSRSSPCHRRSVIAQNVLLHCSTAISTGIGGGGVPSRLNMPVGSSAVRTRSHFEEEILRVANPNSRGNVFHSVRVGQLSLCCFCPLASLPFRRRRCSTQSLSQDGGVGGNAPFSDSMSGFWRTVPLIGISLHAQGSA